MNKIFQQWRKNLIPVELSLDTEGKKEAKPLPWKNGQTYKNLSRNSIALRTGINTINVIDVDTKTIDKLTEPFKSWVEDRMMFEDTLIVESSNGYHFYINTKDFKLRTSTKTGANKSEIPFIDFRGEGGLIFIDSNAEGISYDVICEAEPIEIDADLIAYLPEWQETVEGDMSDIEGFENLDDEDDTEKTVMGDYGGLKTAYEIQELLEPVSSECDRDTWMQLLASAYNLAEDKKEVKDVCQVWSERADNYTESGFNAVWKQLQSGAYGKPFKGGMLVKMSKDNKTKAKEIESKEKFNTYVDKIKNSKSTEEIKNLFDDVWKSTPICSDAQQKALPAICKTRANELEKLEGSGIKYGVDEFKPLIFVEEEEEQAEELTGFKSYHFDNKYHIVKGDKLKGDVTKQSLYTTGSGLGYKGKPFENHVVSKAKLIQGIKHETDYLIEEEVKYSLKASNNPSEFSYLHVLTNPLSKDITYPERQDIIDDFCKHIWNGKAEEAIKLVGLTIRFGETKLNKIHLVAPSNTGKTTLFENIGFQTIHMKRLVQALNADKGIGKNVIDGLKSSGFLLIDEANDPLTQDIKNIDNYIQLDQFGQGGTQDIKLHYTVLTSTHKQAIRNMSDEMYNRLLVIELGKNEPQYPLDKSSLFINENDAYSHTLTQYFKWLLKDALTNTKYKKRDLLKLQDKYRLELNNDVNDMMYEISERVIDSIRVQANSYGDVLEKQGEFYIKRKKDLIGMIDDLLGEHGNVDVGKYSDLLVSHFMPEAKSKSIKVEGKPVKYYPLHLRPFYATEEDAVIDEFEDLDEF